MKIENLKALKFVSGLCLWFVVSIPVPGQPTCIISGGSDFSCYGAPTTWSAPAGMSSYSWSGPGGFTAVTRDISINIAGQYNLTITDATGTTSCSRYLMELPLPFITGPSSVCAGSTGNIYTTQPGPIMPFWIWTIPEGGVITENSGMQITVSWNTPGEKIIMCMDSQCGFTIIYNVTVKDSPPAPTGPSSEVFCSGSGTTVANLSANGTALQWYSAASGGTPLSSTAALVNGTTYYASQTVSGCESIARLAVAVTVSNMGASACTITGSPGSCPGSVTSFSGPPGMINYFWSITGGNATINGSSSGQSVSVTAPAGCSGYSLGLTIINSSGCSSTCSQSINITDSQSPVVSGSLASVAVCNTSDIPAAATTVATLEALAGGLTITDGCAPDASLTVSHSDVETASSPLTIVRTYIITDLCGNASTIIHYISISGNLSAPTIVMITQPSCALSSGSVVLTGLPSTGSWTINPGELNGGGATVTITGLSAGTYNFTVTNSAGCISLPSADIIMVTQPAPPDPTIVRKDKSLESSADLGNQWYNSSGLIPGATGKIYKPVVNDNYYVIVNINGCNSAASNIISFSVGIESVNAFKGISIFPNPAENFLSIAMNESIGPFDFEIINSGGNSVCHSVLTDRSIIDLNHFANGIYFIRFEKDGSYYTLKFIKE